MPRCLTVALLVLSLCACSAGEKPAQPQAAAPDTAALSQTAAQADTSAPSQPDTATVFLKISAAGEPEEFLRLPAPAREWLEKEGYTIPQSWHTEEAHNAFGGDFFKAGTKDWAVLASRNLESRIIVFVGGVEPEIVPNTLEQDINYVRRYGQYLEYGRIIDVTDSSYIAEYYEKTDNAIPITHQGIYVVGKDGSSFALYSYEQAWYMLPLHDEGD